MASRAFTKFAIVAGAMGVASLFAAYRLVARRPAVATPAGEQPEARQAHAERRPAPKFARPASGGPAAGPTEEQAARLAALEQARERAVERARSPAALDQLLAELEATATRQGRVSSFEVEPGLAAIGAALAAEPEEVRAARLTAFSERMGRLSQRLTPPRPAAPSDVHLIDTNQPSGPEGGHVP
jgi:hypothetical protein